MTGKHFYCLGLFSYADPLAFLFSVDKSIGSGCFFPDLDPSVNLIGHAAITEMIKLQFTTIRVDLTRADLTLGRFGLGPI
jgi:hypothetical protein